MTRCRRYRLDLMTVESRESSDVQCCLEQGMESGGQSSVTRGSFSMMLDMCNLAPIRAAAFDVVQKPLSVHTYPVSWCPQTQARLEHTSVFRQRICLRTYIFANNGIRRRSVGPVPSLFGTESRATRSVARSASKGRPMRCRPRTDSIVSPRQSSRRRYALASPVFQWARPRTASS